MKDDSRGAAPDLALAGETFFEVIPVRNWHAHPIKKEREPNPALIKIVELPEPNPSTRLE
jgi:hypothetical protein